MELASIERIVAGLALAAAASWAQAQVQAQASITGLSLRGWSLTDGSTLTLQRLDQTTLAASDIIQNGVRLNDHHMTDTDGPVNAELSVLEASAHADAAGLYGPDQVYAAMAPPAAGSRWVDSTVFSHATFLLAPNSALTVSGHLHADLTAPGAFWLLNVGTHLNAFTDDAAYGFLLFGSDPHTLDQDFSITARNPTTQSIEMVWSLNDTVRVSSVPEPAPVWLALGGAAILLWPRRR
ncbi:MAG: hypothetical protein ACXU8N_21140 [Telluria sp.]